MRDIWYRFQFPAEVRLHTEAKKCFRTANAAAKADAIEGLKRLSGITRQLAEKAGIERPLLAVETAYSDFESSFNRLDNHGLISVHRRPAIYIDPLLVKGLEAFTSYSVYAPELKLTDAELYALLAHEVAHLACPSHWQHAKLKDGPGRAALMRHDELEADRLAVSYGASAEAYASATLKMTRQARMHIWNEAKKLAQAPDADAEDIKATATLERMVYTWRTLEGSQSHPSFRERYERMKAEEKQRVTAR